MQDENIQKVESLVKALLAIGEAQNRGAQGLLSTMRDLGAILNLLLQRTNALRADLDALAQAPPPPPPEVRSEDLQSLATGTERAVSALRNDLLAFVNEPPPPKPEIGREDLQAAVTGIEQSMDIIRADILHLINKKPPPPPEVEREDLTNLAAEVEKSLDAIRADMIVVEALPRKLATSLTAQDLADLLRAAPPLRISLSGDGRALVLANG